MKDLWKNYKKILYDTFPELKLESTWCEWKGEVNLDARIYTGENFIKAREAEVYNDTVNIYNNILYPKTGKNLPCFGMDLMEFFEKKVIIVFDFQHPVENHLFSVGDRLPKAEGTFRFFEPGNHFSEHVYVRKCTASEVDDYLDDFKKYLEIYKELIDEANPVGLDTTAYIDFDNYMRKLDPINGYMASKFDKEKSEKFVNEFLFTYS
jgi:hypothetical protein